MVSKLSVRASYFDPAMLASTSSDGGTTIWLTVGERLPVLKMLPE
jgi:hypothetical protein